jgi:hypothetical protein
MPIAGAANIPLLMNQDGFSLPGSLSRVCLALYPEKQLALPGFDQEKMSGKNQKYALRIGLFETMIAGVLFLSSAAFAQTDPNSSTTNWVPILYGTNSMPDPSVDQQTGSAESDIVGNLSEPSLYMEYNSGYIGFRLRLGADVSPAGFKGCAFIGLDVGLTGTMDLFLGVNNQGSHDELGIWLPGVGANTTPASTSVGTEVFSYTETSLNYSFTPLSAALDPISVNYDLNTDGRTDQFLTFFVPFADVASALATQNINFTTNSVMGLMAATATQPNSLNEDLNGVDGGINSGLTWAQIGGTSLAYTPTSMAPVNLTSVPEPIAGTLFSVLGGMALLQLVIMRRRY